MPTINKILDSTKFVVDNSDLVKINPEKIINFAKTFEHEKTKHWLSAAPFYFSHFNDEQKMRFIFIFNALSFCYWGEPKWTVEYKDKKHDGAWGMILAIGRGIEEGWPLLDFRYCSTISKNDLSKILRGNTEIPLFEERLKILHEIGSIMDQKYDGNVGILINRSNKDTKKLIELVTNDFPSFCDVSQYKNKTIYFYKRAQLLIADIFQIFNGCGVGELRDIDRITACADYKLPQILRKTGILEYALSLAEKIDSKTEIPHNSAEEIEIRANTIWSVEFIKNEVVKHTPQIMSFEINDHLWLATQEKFPDDKPYHRTRTTAY